MTKQRVPKVLTSYLFFSGICLHLLLIVALLTPSLVLHEPLNFFLERTANHLNYHGGSSNQRYLGKLLLKYLPINDWKMPQISQLPLLSTLDNWQGQGASKQINYMAQQYQGEKPLPPTQGFFDSPPNRTKLVHTTKELLDAIKYVEPGDTIQLIAGRYTINQQYISINRDGLATAPITIRSSQLGNVKIDLNALEGFNINAPYWVFENLEIQGTCLRHSSCEHAFHIVGNGHSFVLRNNKIYDFNAPIKVNGIKVKAKMIFPNHGLIEKNSIYNTTPRKTNNPVNLININGADNWVVRSNLISDFAKQGGNRISHGAYMKGNSNNGVFEKNLIICEHTLLADIGTRIGLSFGGGGTGKQFCRDKTCEAEHSNGIIRNNIILNCSHDVAIYLNKAKNTQIYNNLTFNSLGIDIRYNTSSATIYDNILSGRIKNRNGGTYEANNNLIDQDCIASNRQFSYCSFVDWYWDILNADTGLKQQESKILQQGTNNQLNTDFCNNPRNQEKIDIGPVQYSNNLTCSADKLIF
jgi:hypothetical protein